MSTEPQTQILHRLRDWPDGLTVEADQKRAKLAQQAADEIKRLREALTEIATGKDREGLIADFPRKRAQDALDGR